MKQLLSCLAISMMMVTASAQDAELPPAQEERVQDIAETLRCVVCKNQSIADSDADLANDLVNLVRERVALGESDEDVRAYVVDRYGEFVLLKPSYSLKNIGLWFGPFLVLALGGLGAFVFIRSKRKEQAIIVPELSEDEQRELREIVNDRDWPNSPDNPN